MVDGTSSASISTPRIPLNGAGRGTLGEFDRGLRANARMLLSDGTPAHRVQLFADLDLPTDRFTHLAGVVDRTANEARLYVDGALRDRQPLGDLTDLTNGEKFCIGGPPAAGFQGVIDEVRLSRDAFRTFYPVLGESDEGYRRRLSLFVLDAADAGELGKAAQ